MTLFRYEATGEGFFVTVNNGEGVFVTVNNLFMGYQEKKDLKMTSYYLKMRSFSGDGVLFCYSQVSITVRVSLVIGNNKGFF